MPANKIIYNTSAPLNYQRIKPKPIFRQIIEQIRKQILDGYLKPGDLLPSERDLAGLLGVNRHAVREALKVLEYMGVIEGKSGIGTVINNLGQELLVKRIATAAQFTSRKFLIELMELRLILEPAIAALAAERANLKDLKVMSKAMEDMKDELLYRPQNRKTDADKRLHLALANATHNSTFSRLVEPIILLQSEYRETTIKVTGRREESYREHEEIYLAVKKRQSEAARQAMFCHLSQVARTLHKMKQ